MMAKKAYFLSDLHLGATYYESNRELEKNVVRLLDEIKEDADEIYLLGDILDYWFEYKHVVPRGFVRFLGKLAELADSGIKITWIIGNHDIWIFDYLPEELGINVIDGILEKEIFGTLFCMQHGDAIGGNFKFRFIRKLFRNKICQKLYSGIHPRWTVGFAFAWSRHNRLKKQNKDEEKYAPDSVKQIRMWCENQIKSGNPAKYFLFGHIHFLYSGALQDGRNLVVIPNLPERGEYGVFDGNELKIKRSNLF